MASTLINQFIAASATENADISAPASSLADLMAQSKLSLLQFIQALGPTLTSDDSATRSHAVHCLSQTLEYSVEKVKLSNQDINVLLQFLVGKLEDETLVVHVLSGLASLVRFPRFLPHVNDNFKTLAQALVSQYNPRKHLARVRYNGFLLLDQLFSCHKQALSSNPEYANLFTDAFIHVASGEKDPRNLLISFQLNASINHTFSFNDRASDKKHDQLLTDLFDVCFCYFPISFTPPPNDPYKITAAELKSKLRETIASQSLFAQDTFPSLFEKLTSTNPAVRNDVLQTLLLCIEKYDEPVIQQFATSIWDALKFEILHNDVSVFKPESSEIVPESVESIDDSDMNKSLFLTLMAVAATVAKVSSDEFADTFAETILKDLKPNLTTLKSRAVKQSSILLSAVGCVSLTFYNKFVTFLFSFESWGKYIRSDAPDVEDSETEVDVALTTERQRDLIDNLGFIISAAKLLDQQSKLFDYKDHLLIFFGQLLQTSSKIERTLKCKITQQLVKIITIKNFLTRTELQLVLGWLTDNFEDIINSNDDWEKDIFLNEIIGGLVGVMTEGKDDEIHERVSCIKETVLPSLLNHSEDARALEVTRKLCVNYDFLDTLSIRLLNKMLYDECDAKKLSNILNCLISSFNQTQSVKPFLTTSWYKTFVPQFLSVIAKKSNDEVVVLELAGQLLGLVVRYIDQPKQQEVFDDLYEVFVNGKQIEGTTFSSCFETPTPRAGLFKHFLSKIDKTVKLQDTQSVLHKCISVAENTIDDYIRVTYLEILSVLINKFTPAHDEANKKLLEENMKAAESDIGHFEVVVWAVKGLVVRLDKVGIEYLQQTLTKLFATTDVTVSRAIASSFFIIMSDVDVFKNSENSKGRIISGVTNLNVRFLYKQQVFEIVLKKLLEEYKKNNLEKREIELNLLAVIIKNVSTSILKPHLQEVFPLVLDGLTAQNSSVLEASLETFKVIIVETPDLISENLDSLVRKLLDLGTTQLVVNNKLVNKENIRLLSMECLTGLFENMELQSMVKYQKIARDQLSVSLDDKKRSVRKKASDLRQILFELGR